ncbi:MAG: 4Fe-4S binding protein [Deltaproteobacteria bacterium]|nr:4Fe-4S binding protein [Deltaproteobacteria bacterium]
MATIDQYETGSTHFLLGNEAIARGALESGVNFVTGYPGTPSSEIVATLAQVAAEGRLHVEWSTNELAAVEGAGAAATAGLRSLSAMKNAGLSVALDFLTHFAYTGLGNRDGAMVTVVCDDPHGHSSGDETDSRWLARFASTPMLEPLTCQQALDLVKYAFDLSERHGQLIFYRGYTRLCHSSSPVTMGRTRRKQNQLYSDTSISLNPYLAITKHTALSEKLDKIRREFEACPFNSYEGPEKPDLIIVCSGAGYLCAHEAAELLGLQDLIGFVKLVTLWPFPSKFVRKHLKKAGKVLVVEEVDSFVESLVKESILDGGMSGIKIYGQGSGHLPLVGEIAPDPVARALADITGIPYESFSQDYRDIIEKDLNPLIINRGLTWCAGCPHRASFWALDKAVKADGRDAYVTGEIGCSTLDVFPEGKEQIKLLHSMGSGTGSAAGLGQLEPFKYLQPVIAVCGDSSFFHSSVPRLINAVYNNSKMLQIILDNSATAMTGFQAHPGTGKNALGDEAPRMDIAEICRSLGCQVTVADPFEIKASVRTIRNLLKREGVQVLIMHRSCEIVRMKAEKTHPFDIEIDELACKGEECAICSSSFRCPAIFQNPVTGKAGLKHELCAGCGVCADICPFKAIIKKKDVRR